MPTAGVDDVTRERVRAILNGLPEKTVRELVAMARTGELARAVAEKRAALAVAATIYPEIVATAQILRETVRDLLNGVRPAGAA